VESDSQFDTQMSVKSVLKRSCYQYGSPALRKSLLLCSYFRKPEFVRQKSKLIPKKFWVPIFFLPASCAPRGSLPVEQLDISDILHRPNFFIFFWRSLALFSIFCFLILRFNFLQGVTEWEELSRTSAFFIRYVAI
jgi:hypothetical protein